MIRKNTKTVKIGNVAIGGGNPVLVQSMLNTKTTDVEACVRQINELKAAGCQIVRFTVMDMDSVKAVYRIREAVDMPLVADIHFDYRIAIECANAGIDKIRINPGNIGGEDRVKAVVAACRQHNIPIRIGVNGGSLEKEILAKYGSPTADACVESASRHIEMLEKYDYDNIVVSVKSSDVSVMTAAYRKLSEIYPYPLHLGVTEAGTERMGIIKSAVGIGSLLLDGIGDTIRVSLTADPVREVEAGYDILKAVGLYKKGVEIISCPTCGRTSIDLISLAKRVEQALSGVKKPLKVAVMGCVVNGPGEAREADIGIAGGKGEGLIFKHGEIIKKVPENELFDALISEIERM
ncbi:MAG: flavodoxin-dependent (E)-4-hydroxy-3-methylbut-2-enyl-diphosphate synthase [Bacillota bacterium]|nr:flavodoxin-dependent (E)-4-hydroxy-3-methylbut-2-enyl-diphosphate synthase [Bacillota bacterium]